MRTEGVPKEGKELCSKHKVSKYRLAQLTDMSQTALANIMNKKSIPTVPIYDLMNGHYDSINLIVRKAVW